MRKLISILIAVMMVLTLLPVGRVMAEDENVTNGTTKDQGGSVKNGAPGEGEGGNGSGLTELDKAKNEAKEKINAMSNLSEAEKADFCSQVDTAVDTKAIDDIVAKAQKKSDENKAAIEKEAEEKAKKEAKEKINAMSNLSEAEKADFCSQVDTAADTKAIDDIVAKAQKKSDENKAAIEKEAEEQIKAAKKSLAEKIEEAKKAKETDAYKNATKAKKDAFDKALEDAKKAVEKEDAIEETLKEAKKALTTAQDALDGTTTPVVPSDNYSTRVPRAIRTTIVNAKAMIDHPRYGYASDSSRANLENRLATLKSIANDFENGYYNKHWNGKFWNGYYGDEWYDYYDDGYYYRNGVPYTYSGFRAHFGYYPKYDMSDYYGRGYWNGKYRRGYYRDGWYDYYENGYYYRDGVPYTYNQFRREFGYYPDYAYGRRYWDEYDEDWDPYYGYQGRYGYYNSTIRNAVERTIDAINSVANESGATTMTASYPSLSDYDGYYDYYPWYYDPYYYDGYYYDGYYYDQSSSKVRELKKLIGEAEELAASRNDAQWAPYRSELTDAANYGRKAAKGRASVKGAIEELEKAIKKAKNDGMKLYIRRGFMTGVNGTEFNPNGTLTRAEMAQIIENLLEQSGETVAFAPKKFNDVESGRWYKKAVNLISSHNIMKGNPDGNFYPQKPVSIEELIVIAARLGGHTPQNGNVFGISKHYWSVPYIQTAYVKGWIGMDKFDPSAAITRGQAVQILNRSLNYGVDKEFINKYGAQMNQFSDVTMSNPYYYDIIAATNTISYSQVPNSKMRIWRAFQTSGGWSTSKYSNGTYVKPYTGW